MNLVIDIGNTRSKYAFFEGQELLEVRYTLDTLFEDIGKWKETGKSIDVFLSGSGKIDEGICLLLRELSDSWLEASLGMALPLTIGYTTPETLGFDRIAICAGALVLEKECPLLVIDSGTCITFNYVSANGEFLGGNISPGLELRFRSLHQHTARLPYVHPAENYGEIGRTTEEAIRNGVMNGMLFEVIQYIEYFIKDHKDGRIVVTGGNSHFLKEKLDFEVRFCDALGFIGLNEILRYAKKV